MAAARLPLLGANGIRDRLARRWHSLRRWRWMRRRRQRTLHETIAWSHDLLDEPARRLFSRLSVFSGGCRLEEAETVCGPGAELGADVLETIAVLVDHSLVIVREDGSGVRYDSSRRSTSSATDQLEVDERATLRRRHALAYLSLAEANVPEVAAALLVQGWIGSRRRRRTSGPPCAGRSRCGKQRPPFGWRRRSPPSGDRRRGAWRATSPRVARFFSRRLTFPVPMRRRASGCAPSKPSGPPTTTAATTREPPTVHRAQLELAEQIGDRKGAADARFNLHFTEDCAAGWMGNWSDSTSWTQRTEPSATNAGWPGR